MGKTLSEKAKGQVHEAIQNHLQWLEKNSDLEAAEYKKRESEFVKFFRQFLEKAEKRKQGSEKESDKDDKSEL